MKGAAQSIEKKAGVPVSMIGVGPKETAHHSKSDVLIAIKPLYRRDFLFAKGKTSLRDSIKCPVIFCFLYCKRRPTVICFY